MAKNDYRSTVSTGFQAFKALRSADRIYQNPIVHMSSRAEAEEYKFCIRHLSTEILTQATHTWALELSCAGRVPADHPMVAYISSELLNDYRCTNRKEDIRKVLQASPTRIEEFHTTPLSTNFKESDTTPL